MKMRGNASRDTAENYLRHYGGLSFREYPFNEVDSLLLCQLAYLRFDGLIPQIPERKAWVRLFELDGHPEKERLFEDILFPEENRALFHAMLSGKRFSTMGMNCYVNVVEKERETQFSAVTYLLEDGMIYVAYRGTDVSFVGWKEDFNMAYLVPVPGQEMGVKYLNIVTRRFPGPFYVGGHSKGGNLAVYSSMYCLPKVRERIRKIYDMDGPGFRPEILATGRFEAVRDRVEKYLPRDSVVGMLFGECGDYHVVEARSIGLAQHNPFNWRIRDGHFVTAKELREEVRKSDATLNDWILSMDKEQVHGFVDKLYDVVCASKAEGLHDIGSDWRKSIGGVMGAFRNVDAQTRQMLGRTAGLLFDPIWRGRR